MTTERTDELIYKLENLSDAQIRSIFFFTYGSCEEQLNEKFFDAVEHAMVVYKVGNP